MSRKLALVVVVAMVLGGCATGLPPEALLRPDHEALTPADMGVGQDAALGGVVQDPALEGRPIWATKSQIPGGLEFDGVDDTVVTAFSPRMDGDSAFTITAWINTEKSPGTIFATTTVNRRDWTQGTKLLHVHTNGLLLYSASRAPVVRGSTSVVDGAWHHVAVTKDGDIHTLYLDGDRDGTGELNMSYRRANDVPDHVVVLGLLKGRAGSDYPGAFGGRMDDVRFYDRALTPEEIRAMGR